MCGALNLPSQARIQLLQSAAAELHEYDVVILRILKLTKLLYLHNQVFFTVCPKIFEVSSLHYNFYHSNMENEEKSSKLSQIILIQRSNSA